MPGLPTSRWIELPPLTFTGVVDILCVAFLIYQLFTIVRGRRAAHIFIGLGVIAAIYAAATYARLELLRTLLATLAPYTGFALIVVFQSEIRRVLARLGRSRFAGFRELQRREVAEEILLAVAQLSQQKTGALIVIERHIGLRTFVESGVSIDGKLSRDLLCCIFHPRGELHDGAVILQSDRIAAAACFLPLTTNPALLNQPGARHRAAIGVTEESDCLAIVVSEETGLISAASFGEIENGVTLERLEQRLTSRSQAREAEHLTQAADLRATRSGS